LTPFHREYLEGSTFIHNRYQGLVGYRFIYIGIKPIHYLSPNVVA